MPVPSRSSAPWRPWSFGGCRTGAKPALSTGTTSSRQGAKSGISGLILGGLSALLLILSGCATVAPQTDGPPPRPETTEALIYQWDAAERKEGPAPAAYRDAYVAALKALSASLAETEKWRHRAEGK